jgi:simple sugar transport system substrate-binding protein
MWGPWLADAVGEEPCRVMELQGIAGSSPAIDGASGLRNAIADQGNR